MEDSQSLANLRAEFLVYPNWSEANCVYVQEITRRAKHIWIKGKPFFVWRLRADDIYWGSNNELLSRDQLIKAVGSSWKSCLFNKSLCHNNPDSHTNSMECMVVSSKWRCCTEKWVWLFGINNSIDFVRWKNEDKKLDVKVLMQLGVKHVRSCRTG